MSNIYIQEPPTSGKVLLKTSVGDIDIELWSKETPKACRNFIQLCMEGYYDGTIFHRIVKGFIAQGGDPTGTGTGGESIYGQPFKDEFHTRLRFIRRGLLAMANAGKDDNASQFFFTLGATPELQNKHTIFGKVTGETVFNMMKLDDALVDHDDRPQYPPKIIGAEVLHNPFSDIVPRVLPKQKEKKQSKKKEKQAGVKNFKLLSFGEEAEEDEEQVNVVNEKLSGKGKSTHDVLDDPNLSSVPAVETVKKDESDSDALSGDQQSSDSEDSDGIERQQQVESIKSKLKKMNSKSLDKKNESSDSEEEFSLAKEKREERKRKVDNIRKEIDDLKKSYKEDKKRAKLEQEPVKEKTSTKSKSKPEDNPLYVAHEEEMKKFKEKTNFPKKGASRESFTLGLLDKFRQKLHAAKEKNEAEGEKPPQDISSDEDDTSDKWMAHKLNFKSDTPILAKDANTKDDDWYEIHDPRSKISQQRREISKSLMKKKEKR
ncbi:Spliceosome-associated protein CWC27-like protein [Frankliniella fusca]|uniref:Spliceosome-associated protein CWC27 homolog n=1 Tax=Frankliniella fusca TaxID=407009 RepID=A0AAE1LCR9_9NEOP|nr:Spliceosome-associated protein CWC27-like protein [Frankliniella fusca]